MSYSNVVFSIVTNFGNWELDEENALLDPVEGVSLISELGN